jgi:hypothetical protein
MDKRTKRKLDLLKAQLASETDPAKSEALRREIALAEATMRIYIRIGPQ